MGELVRFDLESGGYVLLESVGDDYGLDPVSREDGFLRAKSKLEAALATIKPAAEALIKATSGLDCDEREIQFSVTLNAEVGAVIAKAGSSAHVQVTLISRARTADAR